MPVWLAAFPGSRKPLRRATRYQGYFPVNLNHAGQLAEAIQAITALRPDPAAPYDGAVALPPGTGPAPYARAGATWSLTDLDQDALTLDQVRGVIRDGPAS